MKLKDLLYYPQPLQQKVIILQNPHLLLRIIMKMIQLQKTPTEMKFNLCRTKDRTHGCTQSDFWILGFVPIPVLAD